MTLLELIQSLVDMRVIEVTAENDEEERLRRGQAEELHAEIKRRLIEIHTHFKSTEAVRIRMILDSGSDAGWRA